MNVQMSSLELQWRDHSSCNGQPPIRYLDFVVDGRSLLQSLRVNLIGSLGWLSLDYEHNLIAQLLLQAPSTLKSGRYILYVCPECGDINCGAVTIAIQETSAHFVWLNFGYENDYEDVIYSLNRYASLGPFYFNKIAYKRAFNTQLNQFEI